MLTFTGTRSRWPASVEKDLTLDRRVLTTLEASTRSAITLVGRLIFRGTFRSTTVQTNLPLSVCCTPFASDTAQSKETVLVHGPKKPAPFETFYGRWLK